MTVRCDGRRGIWEGAKEAGRRGNFDAIKIGDVFEEAVGPAAAAVCRPPASGDIAEAPANPGLWQRIKTYVGQGALDRFVGLPPSPLELREKLEQLRALEAGMRIDAMEVTEVPLGVDTPADLDKARAMLAPHT